MRNQTNAVSEKIEYEMDNMDLQSAIDQCVAHLKPAPFAGKLLSQTAIELMEKHLEQLLMAQAHRAGAFMLISEMPHRTPGDNAK